MTQDLKLMFENQEKALIDALESKRRLQNTISIMQGDRRNVENRLAVACGRVKMLEDAMKTMGLEIPA